MKTIAKIKKPEYIFLYWAFREEDDANYFYNEVGGKHIVLAEMFGQDMPVFYVAKVKIMENEETGDWESKKASMKKSYITGSHSTSLKEFDYAGSYKLLRRN